MIIYNFRCPNKNKFKTPFTWENIEPEDFDCNVLRMMFLKPKGPPKSLETQRSTQAPAFQDPKIINYDLVYPHMRSWQI